ncbi:FecR family protein [Marinifilum caeruleilacunae]|nr:FecR family protein [Marinifilum caeruleilacunae]
MNNHTKEYIKISELLYRKQSGLLSEKEQVELDEWEKKSEENKKIVSRLSSAIKLEEKQLQYDSIDPKNAWQNIESQISAQKPKERKLLLNFMKYAAAIVLPLAIGGLLVYQAMNTADNYSDAIVEQIVPGTNKATLVLADGSTINLEEQKDTLIAGKALNQNNKLRYDASGQLAQAEARWHKLVVPVGGEYKLELADGTTVWINSDSELRYTDQFVGKERIVHLKGNAIFKVEKDSEHPFIVKTDDMDVRVYGTEFSVMAYPDEAKVQTTLLEGSVGVALKNKAGVVQTSMIKPNMQVQYYKGDVKGEIREVEAYKYFGWRDGKFQFDNEELGSIMRKLERWYGVKFFASNQDVLKIRFSGEMKRFDDFSTILNLLEYGTDIEFDVHGTVVTARSAYK